MLPNLNPALLDTGLRRYDGSVRVSESGNPLLHCYQVSGVREGVRVLSLLVLGPSPSAREVRGRLAEDFLKICCMVLHFLVIVKFTASPGHLAQAKFGKRKGMVFSYCICARIEPCCASSSLSREWAGGSRLWIVWYMRSCLSNWGRAWRERRFPVSPLSNGEEQPQRLPLRRVGGGYFQRVSIRDFVLPEQRYTPRALRQTQAERGRAGGQ